MLEGNNLYTNTLNPIGWIDPLGLCRHAQQAKDMGYRKINERSYSQAVYHNPKASIDLRYITPHIDGHNGGFWNAASSIRNLGSKSTRSGTYNIDLTVRIGG
ncbi:toxin C-terminal domain-containing protein [Entomomonas asaccharolytica]|uniref:Novel toxin 21 domain-containing protein n=1 Tax=Entomomonas asaccharolytica TaxID=2785331 RepID=A0A974NE01_9GAMM|nr:toxin C-terminal domain-containing protein [Entomomonas asaccharolytica]QQP84803.1 hypothetical protein JHT90_10365 [Entomomonas asaccharolytica]